jgi:hypothetical protein
MYKNYEEYEFYFEEMLKSAPKNIKFKKLSLEEFLSTNYKDKVEWYLCEEWNLDPFHEIFFSHSDMESETMSPEEILYEKLYHSCTNIIENGRINKVSVNQTALEVLNFLKEIDYFIF